MAKRMKTPAHPPVPQTEEDVNTAIRRIGELQRLQASLKVDMDDEVSLIKAGYEAPFSQAKEDLAGLAQGIQTWCEANRAKITNSGKVKFHRFLAGDVSWRTRPPKVTLRGVETLIEFLKKKGFKRWLRVKTEIDKGAMLKELKLAATIKGVKIGSEGEDFIIKPLETDTEAVV